MTETQCEGDTCRGPGPQPGVWERLRRQWDQLDRFAQFLWALSACILVLCLAALAVACAQNIPRGPIQAADPPTVAGPKPKKPAGDTRPRDNTPQPPKPARQERPECSDCFR